MKFQIGSWKDWVCISRGTLLSTLSSYIGSVGSTALTGHPEAGALMGAAVGGALEEGIQIISDDFIERQLSRKEVQRVNEVIAHAVVAARIARSEGKKARNDDFFDAQPNEDSSFNEIMETVLQKAKNEGQSRKLPFLGHLISEMAVRSDVSADEGFAVLNKAESLSYKQFCILSIMGQKRGMPLKDLLPVGHPKNFKWEALRQEYLGLEGTFTTGNQRAMNGLEVSELTSFGELSFYLLGLNGIQDSDIDDLYNELFLFQDNYDKFREAEARHAELIKAKYTHLSQDI